MSTLQATLPPRPGPLHGPYPQRLERAVPAWLALADRLGDALTGRGRRRGRARAEFVRALDELLETPWPHDAVSLQAEALHAAAGLRRSGFTPHAVAQAQRVVAAAVRQVRGLWPYRTQHLAAFDLLQDSLVELPTGEGKTLAVLMAAATAALAGVPVHVITANEYLARRDAEAAQPVLAALGLEAGSIAQAMDADARRAVYRRDVVYATVQEVGFDYLRDRLAGSGVAPVLRGLCLALVDECDTVMLDHAKTPLLLATEDRRAPPLATVQAAYALCAGLVEGADFRLERSTRRVTLNWHAFEAREIALCAAGLPADRRLVSQMAGDALTARHLLQRDVHYVVKDGEVVLIDQTTGRLLPGTVWSQGLHRMVCVKEGVTPPPVTQAAMHIALQMLIGRYCKLGGISGTLHESRAALWFFYRTPVVRMRGRVASACRHGGTRVFATHAQQFDAVAARVRTCMAQGRPVLVGTDSVQSADRLSRHLAAAGIAHQLLTARDDAREAALVREAGAPCVVTVTTNMAGRGTDIPVAPAALAAGGLHVIGCALNVSGRIDRQLFGRTARNGQPGSAERILCLADPALQLQLPAALSALARRATAGGAPAPDTLGRALAALAQRAHGWGEFLQSWQLVRRERQFDDMLAFATPGTGP